MASFIIADPGGRAAVGIAGSNSTGKIDVCRVLSGRGLCEGPIACPEEPH
jgi:ABC-type polysaccharide/polyol phosphate transport system ATPase subunit